MALERPRERSGTSLMAAQVLMCGTQFALRKLKISASVPLEQPAGWTLPRSNSVIILTFLILGR